MKTKTLLITLALTLGLTLTAHAAIPHVINFQGKATNTAGAPLDGAYALTIRIYDAQEDGNKEWEEVHSAVQITNGIFQVLLGSVTALDLDFNEDYWISVQIDSDSEMSPRTRLASVGYAYTAKEAEHAIIADQAMTLLMSSIPPGSMMMWPTDTPPTGWILCDGSEISRTIYAELFATIGTTYGNGDGSTTFNLPDLRGRFPLGKDSMGGTSGNRATDAAADTLGGSGGDEAGVAAHSHSYTWKSTRGGDSSGGDSNQINNASFTTGTTGTATGNMPPYLTINYIIKAQI